MKNNIVISFVFVSLVIGLGVGYGFGVARMPFGMMGQTLQEGGHMMPDGTMMGGSGKMGMADMMTAMNAELEGKTGDAFDQAFLAEMIVHHEGAVAMAQLALTNAKHQEIKDLAKAIVSAQNKEIAEMRAWQKAWYNQ